MLQFGHQHLLAALQTSNAIDVGHGADPVHHDESAPSSGLARV